MPAQRIWLQQLATLLIESERSEGAWAEAVRSATKGRRKTQLVQLTRDVFHRTTAFNYLETRQLCREFSRHPKFVRWWSRGPLALAPPLKRSASPQSTMDRGDWDLPKLQTLTDLQERLALHGDDFRWLLSGRSHYHHQWLEKRSGGRRLLESPKPLLKQVQRRLLRELLDPIPPHECSHGFRRGHGIRNHVAPHCGQAMVLKMDLTNFFPTIGFRRIKHLFMALGFHEQIALALTRLTTTSTRPRDATFAERELYHRPHLPQGAPTSPALANLAAFRLDCRLAGLARSFGGCYSRYADDLLFSEDSSSSQIDQRLSRKIASIALEEGFTINFRKTKFMPSSTRQEAVGLVFNQFPNCRRRDIDQLKAILTNCLRTGPARQNRDEHPDFRAHLLGRLQWLQSHHPAKAEKLTRLFTQIDWES
ncbi:MAG: reverse transcriptase family protein [Verrucomicrobiota bacterium JB023]|nr:reverse transcriptase family protein [Verrucomicrobiota bacterium JB023]